jgi:hypothetical protein
VFAGAARKAVFSNPAVIRRVKADFIPVALKAGLVNNPPVGLEGMLYREIGRSKPAPQGICVANSDGKVLDWVLMFDGDESVINFLDHCLKRFDEYPEANKPVPAERYMRFPSHKLDDVKDTLQPIRIPDSHANGTRCPAKPALQEGTLVGRVVGRALDDAGKPNTDVVLQENYLEARFEVPLKVQSLFATALVDAGSNRFQVPDAFVNAVVSHAYLGQLDVNPLGGPRIGGKIDHNACEFWAQRVSGQNKSPVRVRITGRSNIAGSAANVGRRSDGRRWQHSVELEWEGYLDVQGDRLTHVVLAASGHEKLNWGNPLRKLTTKNVIQNLPAGRTLDVEADVRYGLIAAPCSAEEVGDAPVRVRSPATQRARMAQIQEKMQKVQREVRNWRQRGKNPKPIIKLMQQFEALIKTGRIDKANAVLDAALKLLADDRRLVGQRQFTVLSLGIMCFFDFEIKRRRI